MVYCYFVTLKGKTSLPFLLFFKIIKYYLEDVDVPLVHIHLK